MSEVGKPGSSRRKGDDFQDLVALQFALEYYIANKPFQMYLEYERSGNLDDIVIFDEEQMIGNQVKYAVHTFDVYEVSHFLNPECRLKRTIVNGKSLSFEIGSIMFPLVLTTICCRSAPVSFDRRSYCDRVFRKIRLF